ncbi:hypothetical protein Tco_0129259 [Tanacetum coccineum]
MEGSRLITALDFLPRHHSPIIGTDCQAVIPLTSLRASFVRLLESNKSFPAFLMKSVGSTAPLEKCYEMRKLDSVSYHARGAFDEVLDEGASRSMVVDEGEPAISTALGATAIGTGETTLRGGLKSHTLRPES